MATSKIKTGLRLVKIPNNLFTWDSSNKFYKCSKTDLTNAVSGMSVISFFVRGYETANIILGINYYPSSSSQALSISGWNAKTGASIDGTYSEKFAAYAIGY